MPTRGTGSRRTDVLDELDVEDRDPRPAPRRARRPPRGWRLKAQRAWRVLRWVALGALVLAVVGTATTIVLFVYWGSDSHLPKIEHISDYHPKQLVRVLDRDGKPIGELGSERRTLVPFAEIPKVFLDAVVAAEDAGFYENSGLDYRGILRAGLDTLRKGRFASGGSTITMQVVKNLVLTREKTLKYKIQQWILARRISQKLTKQEILE